MDQSFTRMDDIVKFNVGGTIFQTRRKTLDTDPDCHLAKPEFLKPHYQPSTKDYFFDRNPQIFAAVLNYLRTKELHLPSNVCSAVSGLELEFWGIATDKIERCCWTRYNEWKSNLASMLRLEKNRKRHQGTIDMKAGDSFWTRYRPVVWRFMNHPQSSIPAKILEVTSFLMVLMSLFSFIAATIEPFKRTNQSHIRSHNTSDVGTTTSNNCTSNTGYTTANLSLMSKHAVLNIIDCICVVYFSLDYCFRLAFSPNKRKYVFSLLAVIDFISLLPDYIDIVFLLVGSNVPEKFIDYGSVVRVLRALRIFRLVRHNTGLWVLMYTLKASIKELILLMWFLGIGTMLFASLIYFAEDRELFGSIPDSLWWALITMTTVGYGDYYPITPWGKVVGSLCAMSGLLLMGFTIPIMVNNFVLFYCQIKSVNDFDRRRAVTRDIMTRL